ncbi:peptide chain release factor N(5)-glutamine methyltransferase [Conservatibacter flavescens]|uniref:Release factor glutamine methyltransferase n=1 Tax=Conservatibacter flavescens TaxID=28161 RepID=A0A2M8S5T4_9PAST|nr:peptide chain release factor N(5)-glutamine methyltransferase [Conservatibacter flavescens]PJG86517.1 peptide chain release factor N(5)-glutamine methyltransferase [Conservatibacter flavescens]
MNYQTWLNEAVLSLSAADLQDSPKRDAQLILQCVTQQSFANIFAFGETALSEKQLAELTVLLARRLTGEPMAYILGEKEFWSLPLLVSPDTLIPRPDTEILVESALKIGQDCLQNQSTLRILDLGTGTGAIALALASELKPLAEKCGSILEIIGVDRIAQAVSLAQRNAERNQLTFVDFLQSDWFSRLPSDTKFDMIVSNPPYIEAGDIHLVQGDVRFEPLSALVAEEQGYADLRFIIENAPHFLKDEGWLLLEHGWQQGEKVRSIFVENNWQRIATIKDYGGNERVTLAQYAV